MYDSGIPTALKYYGPSLNFRSCDMHVAVSGRHCSPLIPSKRDPLQHKGCLSGLPFIFGFLFLPHEVYEVARELETLQRGHVSIKAGRDEHIGA